MIDRNINVSHVTQLIFYKSISRSRFTDRQINKAVNTGSSWRSNFKIIVIKFFPFNINLLNLCFRLIFTYGCDLHDRDAVIVR
jgi:hypothetical protein